MIKLAIKSRIAWHNGDYVCDIENEQLTLVYRKENVALSASKAMNSAGVKHSFDDKQTIVQEMKGMTEEDILHQVIRELESAKANKIKLQILEWNYTKL